MDGEVREFPMHQVFKVEPESPGGRTLVQFMPGERVPVEEMAAAVRTRESWNFGGLLCKIDAVWQWFDMGIWWTAVMLNPLPEVTMETFMSWCLEKSGMGEQHAGRTDIEWPDDIDEDTRQRLEAELAPLVVAGPPGTVAKWRVGSKGAFLQAVVTMARVYDPVIVHVQEASPSSQPLTLADVARLFGVPEEVLPPEGISHLQWQQKYTHTWTTQLSEDHLRLWADPEVRRDAFARLYGLPFEQVVVPQLAGEPPDENFGIWPLLYGLPGSIRNPKGILHAGTTDSISKEPNDEKP